MSEVWDELLGARGRLRFMAPSHVSSDASDSALSLGEFLLRTFFLKLASPRTPWRVRRPSGVHLTHHPDASAKWAGG